MPATPVVAPITTAQAPPFEPQPFRLDYPDGPKIPVVWTYVGFAAGMHLWRALLPNREPQDGMVVRLGREQEELDILLTMPEQRDQPGARCLA
jgi:hypothetical protein